MFSASEYPIINTKLIIKFILFMINEKYPIIVSIVAVIVVGVVAFFHFGFLGTNTNVVDLALRVKCDYKSDQGAYQRAIETQNVRICECISDTKIKNTCKDTTLDLKTYSQAVAQFNPSLCNEIKNDNRKQACQTITTSGVKYLSKEDPQYLADIYSLSHNENAIEELSGLLQNNPNNLKNLILLSLAYSGKGLKEQEQGRDQTPYVNKALAIITRAKKLSASNSEVYRAEAYAYEIKPDIFKAIEIYDKAIKLDAKNILAYAGRGHAESMVGILDSALKDFKKAAKLDVDYKNIFIYTNLCRLESSRSDLFKDAVKNCKIVADSKSQDISFRSESSQILATIYLKKGNYSQAEGYLLEAKSLTPQNSNLFVTFSYLYMNMDNYVKAEENAKEAVKLSPTKASARQALSYSLYKQGKFKEAIQEANRGLDLVGDDVSLLTPNKSAMKRNLYYTLANIYNVTSDKENEMKYKKLGDNALLAN